MKPEYSVATDCFNDHYETLQVEPLPMAYEDKMNWTVQKHGGKSKISMQGKEIDPVLECANHHAYCLCREGVGSAWSIISH